MSYTMADFQREYAKEYFRDLTAEERQEVLRGLSAEELLAALSPEQIAKLKKLQSEPTSRKGKPRRNT
jgi:hypothetical protein